MDNFKQKHGDTPLHIYKPSGMSQLGYAALTVFIVIHFAVMLSGGLQLGWFSVLIIPIYAFILWVLLIQSSQSHLAIYEDGLEYRIGSNRTFSTWEAMQRFESRSSGKSRILGIYTIQLEKRHEGTALEAFLLGGHQDFIPLTLIRIPTRWDGCWTGQVVDTAKLAATDFGQQLLHYAPHLFEYGEEKLKNG